ncbi:hypothetical protein E2C01_080901 [Portunus trituberculatus]|uniref:Uncharacterized protein n=1 Tax=Portunus trituberculatus TaxID=210409 RepID=A0A5B7IXA0_PORTR|nr:hypothetical protein [Portunus trituberculatus]
MSSFSSSFSSFVTTTTTTTISSFSPSSFPCPPHPPPPPPPPLRHTWPAFLHRGSPVINVYAAHLTWPTSNRPGPNYPSPSIPGGQFSSPPSPAKVKGKTLLRSRPIISVASLKRSM